MTLITRIVPPDNKNAKLSFVEMDNNLYYLQSLGVSGVTFSNGILTLINPTGGTITTSVSAAFNGGTVSGATTFQNGITANTISGGTYYGLPLDIYVTGGTYTNGEILFKNNNGGNFTVSGLPIGGAGGEVYYLNKSQTQSSYYEFSPIGTSAPQQQLSQLINGGDTELVGAFLTPTGYPNATIVPAGYWTFYIHGFKYLPFSSFDIFCEIYTLTTGGTETLLLTTDTVPLTSVSPNTTMVLTDGYYNGGTIDSTDRILVKIYATNTSFQTDTVVVLTEGQQHYSYGITPFSNFNALTCETLSGCTTIVNLENNKVNKGGDTMTGTLNVPIMSATTVTATTSTFTTISATTYQNVPSFVNMSFGHSSINPSDATTYYIGGLQSLTPSTSNRDAWSLDSQYNGSITEVTITSNFGGGSSENSTISIHNLSAGTSQIITSTLQYVSGTPVQILFQPLSASTIPSGWSSSLVVFNGPTASYAGFTALTSTLTSVVFDGSAYASINVQTDVARFGSALGVPATDGPILIEYSLNSGSTWSSAGVTSTPTSTSYLTSTVSVPSTSSQMAIRFSVSPLGNYGKRLRNVYFNGLSSSINNNYVLGTPLSVTNGDQLQIRWATPTWATNPSGVTNLFNLKLSL